MDDHPSIRTLLIFLAGLMAGMFFQLRVFNDGVPGWKQIVTSDGRGYYAYLPALLLDGDPTYAGVTEREASLLGYPQYKPGYLVKASDRPLNKYFAGVAFLLLPFFLAGWIFTWITGGTPDGYSFFFQFFAGAGTLFYLFAGLVFLRNLLKDLGVSAFGAGLALVVILAGTNLFYYSLWQPTMSHTFSFFAINGFLWFAYRAIRNGQIRDLIAAGFYLGVTCLIRPTNGGVVLLVPFLAATPSRPSPLLLTAWRRKRQAFAFLLPFLAVVVIQPVLWRIQSGDWLLWPYRGEGFRFSRPEILQVLFSYRKGLFVYTPVLALALAGFIPLCRRSVAGFLSVLIYLIAVTWVIASWWNWYYGDGFGLRAFIDHYGVFAILLALAADRWKKRSSRILVSVLPALLILVNLIQTWQYTHGVIHPNSMNEAKFRYIFLRTDPEVIRSLGGNQEMAAFPVDLTRPVEFFNDFETRREEWIENRVTESSPAFSGRHAGCVDPDHPYSPALAIPATRLGKLQGSCFLSASVMVYDSTAGAGNQAMVVLSMDSIGPGENWWQGFRLNDVPVHKKGHWRKIEFSLMLPVIRNPRGILKVYVWNTGKGTILVDDFRVMVFGES